MKARSTAEGRNKRLDPLLKWVKLSSWSSLLVFLKAPSRSRTQRPRSRKGVEGDAQESAARLHVGEPLNSGCRAQPGALHENCR